MDTYYDYYPEEYIIENDLLIKGQTVMHMLTLDHLKEVFRQLVRTDGWLVFSKLDVTHPAIRNSRHYIVPDIAIVKVVLTEEEFWALEKWDSFTQPLAVVVEISSEITWENEISNRDSDKPAVYGGIGVKEYFAYDPDIPQVWLGSNGVRLRAWQFVDQQPKEIKPDAQGRLWSEELQSYFVPAGTELYLTDIDGNRRLTESEIEKLGRQQEALARQQEAQARQKAELDKEQEALARQQAEQALEQSELARQQEALARQEAERRLAELLKQLERNKE